MARHNQNAFPHIEYQKDWSHPASILFSSSPPTTCSWGITKKNNIGNDLTCAKFVATKAPKGRYDYRQVVKRSETPAKGEHECVSAEGPTEYLSPCRGFYFLHADFAGVSLRFTTCLCSVALFSALLISHKKKTFSFLRKPSSALGYPDSNQERQDQNLQCYHYTIPQSVVPQIHP